MISLVLAEYGGLFVVLLICFVLVLPEVKLGKDGNVTSIVVLLSILLTGIVVLFNLAFQNSKDNFHFELTPEKHCDGGPYMYSSNPEKQALCSKFSKADLSRYNCPVGFHGRPIWREGAGNQPPESNDNWQNTRCGNIDSSYNDPQVL